jgi:Co/Zn/Cd efflux system component
LFFSSSTSEAAAMTKPRCWYPRRSGQKNREKEKDQKVGERKIENKTNRKDVDVRMRMSQKTSLHKTSKQMVQIVAGVQSRVCKTDERRRRRKTLLFFLLTLFFVVVEAIQIHGSAKIAG